MDKFEDLVPEERAHGYLRSVMLNVHPSVFLSMDLDAGTRTSACSRQCEAWWNAEPCGSIVLIWKNPAEPSAIEIVNIGQSKRDVIEYDGVLGVRWKVKDDDKSQSQTA